MKIDKRQLYEWQDKYENSIKERDKFKKALEEIITLNMSSVGYYPVLKSDGEMYRIAQEALK